MAFMAKLFNFLKANRYIYTVRKYDYKGEHAFVEYIGICKRTKVTQITNKFDLEPYTPYSGFESTEEWWKQIRTFIKVGEPKYLYKVEAP